jgi:hypothetical protein
MSVKREVNGLYISKISVVVVITMVCGADVGSAHRYSSCIFRVAGKIGAQKPKYIEREKLVVMTTTLDDSSIDDRLTHSVSHSLSSV